MSGGLAPSKSTVYVSNLPFSLTNNDLHRIFSKYGKVVKITNLLLKDRKENPVVNSAVIYGKEEKYKCTNVYNSTMMYMYIITASINSFKPGNVTVFEKEVQFNYNKFHLSGDTGHLSYACPKNMLGEREPPKKKERKKKKQQFEPNEEIEEAEMSEDEGEDPALESLSQAIAFQQAKIEEEEHRHKQRIEEPSTSEDSRRPRIKKSAYFSDEEELSD
uniref:Zinc finger CCHC-type and RNA binding motif containing 1 n=1 Tax=Latimeria chalumnae TaxID=7897 RepID=H3AHA7_LATCH